MLGQLNAEQRRAVVTTEGPVLVLAGAGTGKTRVITTRAGHLLEKGVQPENILAVTFTNKAAREMRERVASVVGKARAKLLTIGTFHSFCARMLREEGESIGIPSNFSICDASDQLSAAKAALRDLHVPETRIHPRALQAEISLRKSRLALPEPVDERDHLIARAHERYQDNLRRSRCLDFDDLLLEAVALLKKDAKVRKRYRERYRYLMVDEYQDTNGPQYEIVRTLAGRRRNLCVVGDDDQSIYGWRGADVKKILNFERDFPGCAVVRLETNYRSTQPILDAANAVISCNLSRHEKTLRAHVTGGEDVKVLALKDEIEESRGVIGDLRVKVSKRQAEFRDFAILFRTAVQSRGFEMELRRANVPYVLVGGQSFFDRKEVRDVLAFLRMVANPDDEVALLRVINTPPRGVGKTSIDRALAEAAEKGWPIARVFEETDSKAAAAVRELRAKLADLRGTKNLVRLVQGVLDAADYHAEIVRCYPDGNTRELRWNGVQEILNLSENHMRRSKKPTLEGFLETMALAATDDGPAETGKRNAVTLMTLHAAKGLEFNHVYLVGAEEGILPHRKSLDDIDEERRLMYVGITRAKRHLSITFVRQRARGGQRGACHPSRFLFEMRGKEPPKGWKAVT